MLANLLPCGIIAARWNGSNTDDIRDIAGSHFIGVDASLSNIALIRTNPEENVTRTQPGWYVLRLAGEPADETFPLVVTEEQYGKMIDTRKTRGEPASAL